MSSSSRTSSSITSVTKPVFGTASEGHTQANSASLNHMGTTSMITPSPKAVPGPPVKPLPPLPPKNVPPPSFVPIPLPRSAL